MPRLGTGVYCPPCRYSSRSAYIHDILHNIIFLDIYVYISLKHVHIYNYTQTPTPNSNTLGHILCLFSLNATDVRCLCGFIGFLSPNGGLWPDHDQITTSVVLLGVQVTDVRRGYLGGRRRRRPDYIMTMARSRPDHNLCVAMHGKSLGVSEVRGQLVSGGQTMGQIWTQESLGVSGDQSMLTREWLGVGGGQVPESSCPSTRCSMN